MPDTDTQEAIPDERIEEVEVRHPESGAQGLITFHLADGRIISAPLSWSWRLEDADPEERENYRVSPSGLRVRWPEVDEDITAEALLRGGPAGGPKEIDPEALAHEAWPPARIKRLRDELDMSQSEFAEKVGVRRQATVSDWETGKQPPSSVVMRTLDLLASKVWGERGTLGPQIENAERSGSDGPTQSSEEDQGSRIAFG